MERQHSSEESRGVASESSDGNVLGLGSSKRREDQDSFQAIRTKRPISKSLSVLACDRKKLFSPLNLLSSICILPSFLSIVFGPTRRTCICQPWRATNLIAEGVVQCRTPR